MGWAKRGLSQLLTLELEDNYFHDGNVSPLAFKPLKRLIYLRLDDNEFRAIPSGLPVSIQELHLSDNKIEVVHSGLLNKTTNLRVLNLNHNRIREDRIHPRAWIHLLKLEYLDLSHNKLVHVPSFLPVGLRQLILHHNQIERIPGYVLGHLRPGLDSLQLSYNRLREDGINEVSFMGLYNSLTELLLDHNQLRSIPRGILQLKALQHLRLNHNYISYITMNSLCDTTAREDSLLVSVHLEYNLIDRRLIPPTAFSCIKTYQSVLLRPQRYEEHQKWKPYRASSLQSILIQAIIQRFKWSNNTDAVPFFYTRGLSFCVSCVLGMFRQSFLCMCGLIEHMHLFCALLQLKSTADICCLTLASAVFITDL